MEVYFSSNTSMTLSVSQQLEEVLFAWPDVTRSVANGLVKHISKADQHVNPLYPHIGENQGTQMGKEVLLSLSDAGSDPAAYVRGYGRDTC